MLINEIFHSIQGESTLSGFPFIFIRLQGCNLRCPYCDTKDSLDTSSGKEMSISEILSEINKYKCKNILLTGGEPLEQKVELIELLNILLKKKYTINLETNGSLLLENIPPKVKKIVDIKGPSSGVDLESGLWEKNLSYLTKKDELKFLISDKIDFEWSVEFIKKNSLDKKECCINVSPIHSKCNMKILSKWILDSGLDIRLNLQIHKIIWGNSRGK